MNDKSWAFYSFDKEVVQNNIFDSEEKGYESTAISQESAQSKVRVFVLAGQSNMVGFGQIGNSTRPGTLQDVVQNDTLGEWSEVGSPGRNIDTILVV